MEYFIRVLPCVFFLFLPRSLCCLADASPIPSDLLPHPKSPCLKLRFLPCHIMNLPFPDVSPPDPGPAARDPGRYRWQKYTSSASFFLVFLWKIQENPGPCPNCPGPRGPLFSKCHKFCPSPAAKNLQAPARINLHFSGKYDIILTKSRQPTCRGADRAGPHLPDGGTP